MHATRPWGIIKGNIIPILFVLWTSLPTGAGAAGDSQPETAYKVFMVLSGEVIRAGGYSRRCLP